MSSQQRVTIDINGSGRTFEGIGALSAGASSRLLINYSEPYRSQILDFLFKPKCGANLQHLKVEIGGDINSTCGTEPSHARTREQLENPCFEYFNRGYEWWLMKEAKKRNPAIYLDCLEWGASGWIGNGKFYSKDNINYIISFIKGAEQYHRLKIDYTGIWNERMYDTDFIKDLRKALDENDLSDVKLVVGDLCCGDQWQIAEDMLLDDDLTRVIDVIGDHYPERDKAYNSSKNVKRFGKPVWNNEGGPWKSDWSGFEYLVKMYNRDYIEGRMTKNITWSLVTSYYNNLSLPNSGLMSANTPWSGYYMVEPAVWAVAHTSQFAEPDWKYIDSGCAYLEKGGSFVTLASTGEQKDFSIVFETVDAEKEQKVTFKVLSNVNPRKIFVWRTIINGLTFEQQEPVFVEDNIFSISLLPKAVYTLTTTTGQQKTIATPPENTPFPFPFYADFDNEEVKDTPIYFSDQGGAFEVARRLDNKGNCLRQVITRKGIEWENKPIFNQTVVGNMEWADYNVGCNIFFQNEYCYATILARVTEMYRSHKLPDAYILKLNASGIWELRAGTKKLASGYVKVEKKSWHKILLDVNSEKIKAIVNGQVVANLIDSTYTKGMAGLGSSFHLVDFDNFSVVENIYK